MPGGDRAGPMGMGPMTGRGAGFCAGFGVPGFANRGARRGFFGRGRGGGRGWRNMFYATGLTGWQRAGAAAPVGAAPAEPPAAPMHEEEEIEMLRAQAEAAAATLEQIRARIDEITAAKAQAPAPQ